MVTYAERPWLKHYDSGVPHSIAPYPTAPLHQYLRDAAQKYADHVALVSNARIPVLGRITAEMSYRELDEASDAFAAALIDMGLKKGDRVAIILPNCAQFVISYYGILKAGGVVAATNPTYPAEKMQFQINDSDSEFVITLTLFYNMVKSVQTRTAAKTIIVTNIKEYLPAPAKILFSIAKEKKGGHFLDTLQTGDHWFADILARYKGKKPNVTVTGEDLAIFQYTGGTTGTSKAAMSQHKAVVANTVQCRALLLATKSDAEAAKEIFLGAIPMYHAYGLITVVGFAISIGARIVLVPNARDIPDLVDVIDTLKPTIFQGVPALYNAINNHPDVLSGKRDMRSIQMCMSGSAPLPPATKREFERLTGGNLIEGFGMSEAPTASHCNPLRGENRVGSVGLPFPDMDMRVVSLDDGETDLPVGEIGELLMTGPQLMVGYHKMPTETANTLREKDGKLWLYTGDIARMDEDGYFYIVDRKKDMALIGGFNVYPTTIEKVLADHPAVQEVGVAAIPHPEKAGQEALKAWIVLRAGQQVSEQELTAHASKFLARYEVPTRFVFVDALPKTNVGKILRRELIEMELKDRENAGAKVPVMPEKVR